MHNLQPPRLSSRDEQVSTEDDQNVPEASPLVRRRGYPHPSPIGLQSLVQDAQELLPLTIIRPGSDIRWTNLDEPRVAISTSSLSEYISHERVHQQFGAEWPCASEPYIPIAGANSPELPSSRIGVVQTYQDMPGR